MVASARASTARWRCPPESSCGIARGMIRAQADGAQQLGRAPVPLGEVALAMDGERLGDLHRRSTCGGRARRADPGRRAACGTASVRQGSLSARGNGLPVEAHAPLVGASRPSARRPVVDLPQPDSPTRPSVRPRSSVSDTPATAEHWSATELNKPSAACGRRA